VKRHLVESCCADTQTHDQLLYLNHESDR